MGGSISKMLDRIFGSKEMRILMLGLDAAGKTSKTPNDSLDDNILVGRCLYDIAEHLTNTKYFTLAILYNLKLDQDVTTIPTVGFNVETVTYKNTKFNVWDVGGQDKIRPLWRHYFSGTQGLVFVVDSSDRQRIEEARAELTRIIQDREMTDALLLVFANKQDISGALKPDEVSKLLRLNDVAKNHLWKVQPSCAKNGDGIFEGLVSYLA